MTDLVERLRKPAPSPLAYGEREAFMMNESERHEAADEIERLRAALEDAVETLEAMNLHVDNPLYNRLRAALENKP